MAKVELIEKSEPTTAEPAQVSQSVGSFFMSVSFWLTLTVAGIMYAAVALSPKLAAWINVRQQYVANATRLTQLEDEVDYLERVAEALKTDPEFAKRLIRTNQNPEAQKAEFIPVSKGLLFGGAETKKYTAPEVVRPAFANVVFHLASHEKHRTWLLAGSAGLTLLAFTLLNDAGIGIVQSALAAICQFLRWLTARYRKPPAPAVDEGTSTDVAA
ncbi:MAG: hypothetical protein U0936_20080 [Planctomycetaceae bacterium]